MPNKSDQNPEIWCLPKGGRGLVLVTVNGGGGDTPLSNPQKVPITLSVIPHTRAAPMEAPLKLLSWYPFVQPPKSAHTRDVLIYRGGGGGVNFENPGPEFGEIQRLRIVPPPPGGGGGLDSQPASQPARLTNRVPPIKGDPSSMHNNNASLHTLQKKADLQNVVCTRK